MHVLHQILYISDIVAGSHALKHRLFLGKPSEQPSLPSRHKGIAENLKFVQTNSSNVFESGANLSQECVLSHDGGN